MEFDFAAILLGLTALFGAGRLGPGAARLGQEQPVDQPDHAEKDREAEENRRKIE